MLAATVSGVKYTTVSDSGFSPGDAPLGGVTINLYEDTGDGMFNPIVDTLIDQEVTAPGTGEYEFTNIADGLYFITETIPAGYIQSAGPAYYAIEIIDGAVYSAMTLSIDDFSDPNPAAQFFISALDPNPYFRQDTGANIIGGERDLLVEVLGVPNPISANGFVGINLASGVFNLGTGASGAGSQVVMQYDGLDATINDAMLLMADLTAGGANGFRFDFNFLQVGTGTTMPFEIHLTSTGGGTAVFSGLIDADTGAFSLFVPYAGFATMGSFDFADVTSLEFVFNQTGVMDVDFEIDQIVAVEQRNTDYDFGNFPLPSRLSGLKYVDANDNGNYDPGEPPVGGVIITLTGTDDLGNAVYQQTLTLADGTYEFTNLRPGTYQITETPPINFIIGQPTIGSLGGFETSNTIISNIVVPAAANGVNYNFGEIGLKPGYASKRSLIYPAPPGSTQLTGIYPVDPMRVKSAEEILVIGSDANPDERTQVKVVDIASGNTILVFTPYGASFRGGVRVAVADLDGDGIAEIITAPGAGRDGLVKVFDLLTGKERLNYRITPYSKSFEGGVFVATGDVNGDGRIDIITSPGEGMKANVRVFGNRVPHMSASKNYAFAKRPQYSFLAFGGSFKGGATVAAGDFNFDGKSEIVVGNGPGMGPRVRVFDLVAHTPSIKKTALLPHVREILPMDSSDRGGVFVAVGNLRGDLTPEIIVGNGAGGRGRVEMFNADGSRFKSFTAYDNSEGRNAPVHVAAKSIDATAVDEVLTGQGSPGGSGLLRARDADAVLLDEDLQAEPEFFSGFFLA